MQREYCNRKKPVGLGLSSNMHMYFALDNYIYSFSSMSTYVFFVWHTNSLFLFMSVTFEIVQTCISIQNTNAHEMLGDSHKYFTFVSHAFSFTSMIP